MKIYTRTGDDGTTGLFDGSRVSKDHPRVEACGAVDELNSHLGILLAIDPNGASLPNAEARQPWTVIRERLIRIQNELFDLGAEIATPDPSTRRGKLRTIDGTDVARLESWIDEATAVMPALKYFILPGGTETASQLHVCRSVCRRAERRLMAIDARELNPCVLHYLNRLADLLFTWARLANQLAGRSDVSWGAAD